MNHSGGKNSNTFRRVMRARKNKGGEERER
jgi:hypothetical protein